MLTYFQLCAEDYRWWWRSMLAPGASGVYLYAYCIFYYMANLEVTGWVSQLLYFGYMGLVACVFTFITGATGFLATFWFVRTIYSAIKVREEKRARARCRRRARCLAEPAALTTTHPLGPSLIPPPQVD